MATNDMQDDKDSKENGKRGFAAMNEDQQREIASKGGKAAHEKGTAHEFDSESGREAGRTGGQSGGSSRDTSFDDND